MAYNFKKETSGRVSIIDTTTTKKIQSLNPGLSVAINKNGDLLLVGPPDARDFQCSLSDVAGWTDAAGVTTTFTYGTTNTDTLLDALGGFFF